MEFKLGELYYWSYEDLSEVGFRPYKDKCRYMIVEEYHKGGVSGFRLRDMLYTEYDLTVFTLVPHLDDLSIYNFKYLGNISDCKPITKSELWMYADKDIVVGTDTTQDPNFVSYIKKDATVDKEIMCRYYGKEINDRKSYIDVLNREINKLEQLKKDLA